jgi:thiamine monophosphate synthase
LAVVSAIVGAADIRKTCAEFKEILEKFPLKSGGSLS